MVKQKLGEILELDPLAMNYGLKTTMNSDEAVARGGKYLFISICLIYMFMYVYDMRICDLYMNYGFKTTRNCNEAVARGGKRYVYSYPYAISF
jgi:hypothetical protein